MKEILGNPRAFIPHWAKTRGITVKGNGIVEGIDIQIAFATLWLDYTELCNVVDSQAPAETKDLKEPVKRFNPKTGEPIEQAAPKQAKKPKMWRIPEKDMEKAWSEWPVLEQNRIRETGLGPIMEYTGDTDHAERFLMAVTGQASALDIAALKHVLWQIKRKANKQAVVHHLCSIFFGKQGGGKTTAILKLLEPVQDFVLDFDPNEAIDPRNAQSLSKNLVCFFDEMANMARVEMESLKKLITNDYLTYRPLYTNNSARVPQSCTFIGGSNKSMSEIIYDPTGMRRFYEFSCLDKTDHAAINGLDYVALWNSVNPELDRGYIEPFLQDLQQHQASHQIEDEVQHFLREQAITGGKATAEIQATDLYNHFTMWRALSGYSARPAPALNSFCMKLRTHKLSKRITAIDGKNKTVYSVNKASHIFDTAQPLSAKMLQFKGNA
jgi:hypothetical protein